MRHIRFDPGTAEYFVVGFSYLRLGFRVVKKPYSMGSPTFMAYYGYPGDINKSLDLIPELTDQEGRE